MARSAVRMDITRKNYNEIGVCVNHHYLIINTIDRDYLIVQREEDPHFDHL